MNSVIFIWTTGMLIALFVLTTTTNCMLQSPKLAILQSLDAMDRVQMEEVFSYIKRILSQSGQKSDPKAFKKEAMKEIRQALRRSKKDLQLAAWSVWLYLDCEWYFDRTNRIVFS